MKGGSSLCLFDLNLVLLLQSEMKSSKSSVLAGVDGSVAADFLSTLSFVTDIKPVIVTGT